MPNTPGGVCHFFLDIFRSNGALLEGSRWDFFSEKCYLGYKFPGLGGTNGCYPSLDVLKTILTGPTSWYYDFVGCTGTGEFTKTPVKGEVKLQGGLSFKYEGETCANGCNVSKYGLTPAAKNALGSLRGRILGKTYVQIRDYDGNLTTGEFKLCFPAKEAQNPS